MLVALTGRKFSGKSSAAHAIAHPKHHFSFAEELKWTAKRWYRLSDRQVNGDLKEVLDTRWGLTPRQIMQRIGTEVARSIHEDTWVRFLLDQYPDPFPTMVITDCRFPNEAAAVRNMGGKVIRIVRPSLVDNEFSNHPSETAIDTLEVDAEVVNDASMVELGARVAEALGRLGVRL